LRLNVTVRVPSYLSVNVVTLVSSLSVCVLVFESDFLT
jgi:hypothetical protein